MTISELITQLTSLQEQHGGDLSVMKSSVDNDWLHDTSAPRYIFMDTRHHYEIWQPDATEADQQVIVL